jgi:SAM-dependent methyltransferase
MVDTNSTFSRFISCINCGTTKENHHRIIKTTVSKKGFLKGATLSVVACEKCGLVFLNPQPIAESIRQFYSSEYYDNTESAITLKTLISHKAWLRNSLYSWLVGQLNGITGSSVLDIGSGYGLWLHLFDKSNHLAGVELSRQAANIAREIFELSVYELDFLENKFKNREIDLVTALAVIEHFPNPLAVLAEVNRILKRGGHLYLYTPDLHALVLRNGIDSYFKLVHLFYFSFTTLSSLLSKAGFEVIAYRQNPAIVKERQIGTIEILARKEEDRSLEEAQTQPPSCNDFSSALYNVELALKRDRLYIWFLGPLYRRPKLLALARWLRKVSKRNRITMKRSEMDSGKTSPLR